MQIYSDLWNSYYIEIVITYSLTCLHSANIVYVRTWKINRA